MRLAGRDIYLREGCYNCHSQMIRPFRAETERYGHYSVAGEFVYDHPFQWGSKRTGPDLARVGGRYSDQWHRIHLLNPRDVVPESNMPAYYWLERPVDASAIDLKMTALRKVGVPYSDEDIAGAKKALEGQDRTRRADCLPAGHGNRPQADEVIHGHQRFSFAIYRADLHVIYCHRVLGLVGPPPRGVRSKLPAWFSMTMPASAGNRL